MLKNYFKIAVRSFWKTKTSGLINITGLSVGMACCILILIYIKDELGYNQFNANFINIYCVNWSATVNGLASTMATTPLTLAPAMVKELPQVQFATRMYQRSGSMEVQQKTDKKFQEQNVYFSDNDLFSIFTISFLQGDPTRALIAPNTVVITDEMAAKYFGNMNPVGKSLYYDNKAVLLVTGVVQKMPRNSDLQFDFLISLETLYTVENPGIAHYLKTDWSYNPAYTFCLMKPGQDKQATDHLLNGVLKKYGDERSRQLFTVSAEPLKSIHLYASSVVGNLSANSIAYLYIFGVIAVLILFIANINFINLSTARSNTRAREVSMRKVLGATKRQLVVQFLGENLLSGLIALFLSFGLCYFGIDILNQLTGKHLSHFSWLNIPGILLFTGIFATTSILAGLYPAFFITRFNPALTLKGRSGETSKKNLLRKSLLVAQFTISITLIISSVVIYRQLQYLRNKPLGFQKEQMLNVPIFGSGASSIGYGVDGPMRQRMNGFTNVLLRFSKINAATAASGLPGQGFVQGLVIPEGFSDKDNIFIPWVSVDYNFISTFKIPVVAGRDFSKTTGTDHLRAFILNESAVKKLGWKNPEAAIGKTMIRGDAKDGKRGQVIGVIKDFNFNTLDQPMQPLIVDINVPRFTQFAISIQADHVPETISYIKKTWNDFFPERVFEYSFLDKDINALYNDKENLSRMIEYFAIIAILLSCLGLFSLTSFLSVQRTKEIGIRKVLGATAGAIISLLSFEFLRLTIIAFIIASPIAWYSMHSWLMNYAYRTNIPWWIFLCSGIFVLVIAGLTVAMQSIKAAIANPVSSLKTEG